MELRPDSFAMIVVAALLVVIIAGWLLRKGIFAPRFERYPLMS